MGDAGKSGAGKVFALEEIQEDRNSEGSGTKLLPLCQGVYMEKRERLEKIMFNMK